MKSLLITPRKAAAPPGLTGRYGFAHSANVTGGLGGTNIVVTNLNNMGAGSLREALQQTSGRRMITFAAGLNGTIDLTGTGNLYIDYPDVTVDGKGNNITITPFPINCHTSGDAGVENVIIKNLTFGDTAADKHGVNVDKNGKRVWIDHCTFSNNSSGSTGNPITVYHGSYDAVHYQETDNVTISWCRFIQPNVKSILIGSASENDDETGLRVSIHHCLFDGVDARNPRVHGGATVHAWNNLVRNWSEVGTALSGTYTDFLAENCIYENEGGYAIDSMYTAYQCRSSNHNGLWLKGTSPPIADSVGTFPRAEINYRYALEAANQALYDAIVAGAGANNG